MPMVFHDINYDKLKNTLSERYLINFDSISEETNKLKGDIKSYQSKHTDKSLKNDIYVKICIELVQLSLKLCEQSLPVNSNNFFGNKHHKSNIKDYCSFLYNDNDKKSILTHSVSEYEKDSLLKYVVMDAFMHIYKYVAPTHPEGYRSPRAFYLNQPECGEESKYKTMMRNDKEFQDVEWLNDFRIFTKKWDEIFSEFSPFLSQTAFLIIQYIRSNPYCKKTKKDKTTGYSSLTLEKLIKFMTIMYNQTSPKMINFKYKDPALQAASYYYLDQLFDFENISHIAAELASRPNIKGELLNNIINVIYQSILIPNPFSKKKYINELFFLIDEKPEVSCRFRMFKLKNPHMKEHGISSDRSTTQIEYKNLILYREYIQYLSKIYFPILSACFYVLLFEVFGKNSSEDSKREDFNNIYELLSYIAEKKVLPYYDKQCDEWKKIYSGLDDYYKEPNKKEYAPIKKFEDCLCLMYDMIRNNIYDNEKYHDIINSLKIDTCFSPTIRMNVLNQIIDYKISANLDAMSDPIPNENSNQNAAAI